MLDLEGQVLRWSRRHQLKPESWLCRPCCWAERVTPTGMHACMACIAFRARTAPHQCKWHVHELWLGGIRQAGSPCLADPALCLDSLL